MPFVAARRLLTASSVLGAAVQLAPSQLFARQHPILAAESGVSRAAGTTGLRSALAAALHADGILLWPGAPVVRGSGPVKQFLAAQQSLNSLRFTFQARGVALSHDSTLGYTWGIAASGWRNGSTAPRVGRYIAAWRRDGERWSIAALLLQGLTSPGKTTLPANLPLALPPATEAGEAGAFVAADVAFAQLAVDSGAAIAFERYADEDAVIGSGLQVRGPKAIGRAVADPASWRWHPVAAGAARSGDLGWTVGESVVTPAGGEPGPGKYLTIWRKRSDGTVRFLTDGGNARPPTQ